MTPVNVSKRFATLFK